MHLYIYTHLSVYIYISIYLNNHVNKTIRFINILRYMYIYICICILPYILYISRQIYIYMYIHMYIYIYMYIYINKHTCGISHEPHEYQPPLVKRQRLRLRQPGLIRGRRHLQLSLSPRRGGVAGVGREVVLGTERKAGGI